LAIETWLPIGFALPDGAKAKLALYEGQDWQIVETQGHGRALIAREKLALHWIDSGLLEVGSLAGFLFGIQKYFSISCGPSHTLAPLVDCNSPNNKSEALAFAIAFKTTRGIDKENPLQDAIYVEKLSRLLPTYSITSRTEDDVVLGYWLTGGARVSVKSFRRLRQMMSWIDAKHLKDVIMAAGIEAKDLIIPDAASVEISTQIAASGEHTTGQSPSGALENKKSFSLPGRPKLESFFNEHVVEIIINQERYKALGIEFPPAIILHGPPGCGKTFAVERLIEYLGWPSFQIDASSVASPYIHETSRKVSEVFDKAMQNAPSVLVIDEMEAFLAGREYGAGGSHHRVEEMAEFLRRIPEATKNRVLIIAMTNRLEMIDVAIMRRGRFDHVIKVDFASEDEIRELLEKLLSNIPREDGVQAAPLAKKLAGRPLSDVTFVVREGARLSARSGKDKLVQDFLLAVLDKTPSRGEESFGRRIGFV